MKNSLELVEKMFPHLIGKTPSNEDAIDYGQRLYIEFADEFEYVVETLELQSKWADIVNCKLRNDDFESDFIDLLLKSINAIREHLECHLETLAFERDSDISSVAEDSRQITAQDAKAVNGGDL